jgi:hypothetical protein
MTEPTDAEWTLAATLARQCYEPSVSNMEGVRAIAVALAEERAKARVPFLALADEYDRHAGLMRAGAESTGVPSVVSLSQAFEDAAASIRRVAKDQPR